MSANSLEFYDFDNLRFVPEQSQLIRLSDGETVSLRSKEKLLLLALVKKPNQTVSYEELRQAVWSEASDAQMILRRLQVTKDTLQKKINNLRQANYNSEIIKSVPLEGYAFTLTVESSPVESENESQNETRIAAETNWQIEGSTPETKTDTENEKEFGENEFTEQSPPQFPLSDSNYAPPQNSRRIKKSSFLKLTGALLGLTLVTVALVTYFSNGEEDEVRRVVKDSQMYESLVLYQNPANFDENKLKEYWIDESHNTDLDIAKIRKGVNNLIQKGIRYGKESKCEKFDFVSVEVNETKDFAVVKTIEKWFVAKYGSDGNLLENRNIGPYAVTYNLRKINGKWLIEKSSTARAGG